MRKFYTFFVALFAIWALVGAPAQAQVRYVDVDPGIGTLNDSISGDTTATGDRIDPENTVYRLQRGDQAYYGLTGSLSNSGYQLTIEAAEGDGARPFLQPRVVGDESARPFRPKGDLTLKGLHVTNMDELGGMNTRMLRCSEDDITITLDDCWFDKDGQSFIRVDNPGQSFYITNCVISNIGHPSSPNNGRGIDDRGNDINEVVFENCTFYNLTSRILRDDGGKINFAKFNQNTIMNIGQMGISFGPVDSLVMTNNLAVNMGFIPMDDDEEWFVLSADSVDGVAPKVKMSNNSAFLDTTLLADYYNDTTTAATFINPTLGMAVLLAGDTDNNANFDVAFTDGPGFADSVVIYSTILLDDLDDAPFWVEPEVPSVDDGGNGLYHLDVPYDFGYAHSGANLYAEDGANIGDRNWSTSNAVGVPEFRSLNAEFSLYPVPATSQVTMSFELKHDASVMVEVYSLTGARVASVINSAYGAGVHQFNWEFDGQLSTGVYLLRMDAGGAKSTAKLIVQ